ncbi:hypothetical protein [Spirosoma utsteinense]|uniref:Outer membrane protein beta-barrel domain-containing protein n=1 Tax=Spirosoma utsteinense TaxID=2585773 RepID=A0ABR6WA78_9BACT|nr:hypothetical protein [Spirosoma utsteinense]MBC3787169.1 hypothetical protein [Spirosoma utsteinense]MBC3792852.1 hypothetical protein [Spirosoma utsteinense]
MKIRSIILLSVLGYSRAVAQQTDSADKQLLIGAGFGYMTIKDLSSSPLRYSGMGATVRLGYEYNQPKSVQRVLFSVQAGGLQNGIRKQSGVSAYKAQLAYSQYWVLNSRPRTSWALGGRADVWANARLFNTRENNPVSYDAGTAISIGTQANHSFSGRFSRLAASFQLSVPVVAYVIRPAYGVPYPEAFLQDGVFNHQDQGLTGPLVSSGRVRSTGDFFRLQTTTSLTYSFSNTKTIRLSYDWEYYSIPSNLPVSQGNQSLTVSFVKHIHERSK